MIVVPNEWLVELLWGSTEDRARVHRFLDRVEARGDILAIRRAGRLKQKILSATSDPQARAKRLRLMLFDELKVRLVEEQEILALPPELQEAVPADDLYLVETAFAMRPCRLVSTDEPLRNIVVNHAGIAGFEVTLLREYLGEAG